MKKYLAEFIGTMMLVFFGCGAAITAGLPNQSFGAGYLGIAVAFGLVLMAMAYSVGNISGCHVNPAVSLAMLITGKLEPKDFIGYMIAQFIGAAVGALVLYIILGSNPDVGINAGGFGCNGYGSASNAGIGVGGAMLTEVILTFCFVTAILGVTSKPEYANVAGLVIGLTLIVIHIVGIPLTGTSVNPARSLGPALFKGGDALQQVWLFILAPFIGGALAAFCHMSLLDPNAEKEETAA